MLDIHSPVQLINYEMHEGLLHLFSLSAEKYTHTHTQFTEDLWLCVLLQE